MIPFLMVITMTNAIFNLLNQKFIISDSCSKLSCQSWDKLWLMCLKLWKLINIRQVLSLMLDSLNCDKIYLDMEYSIPSSLEADCISCKTSSDQSPLTLCLRWSKLAWEHQQSRNEQKRFSWISTIWADGYFGKQRCWWSKTLK